MRPCEPNPHSLSNSQPLKIRGHLLFDRVVACCWDRRPAAQYRPALSEKFVSASFWQSSLSGFWRRNSVAQQLLSIGGIPKDLRVESLGTPRLTGCEDGSVPTSAERVETPKISHRFPHRVGGRSANACHTNKLKWCLTPHQRVFAVGLAQWLHNVPAKCRTANSAALPPRWGTPSGSSHAVVWFRRQSPTYPTSTGTNWS